MVKRASCVCRGVASSIMYVCNVLVQPSCMTCYVMHTHTSVHVLNALASLCPWRTLCPYRSVSFRSLGSGWTEKFAKKNFWGSLLLETFHRRLCLTAVFAFDMLPHEFSVGLENRTP